MTLKEVLEIYTGNSLLGVVLILTLVQIAPIKINPWSFIFKLLGKFFCWVSRVSLAPVLNKIDEIDKKVDDMQSEIKVVKKEFEIKNANDWRWDILDFFNSSRNNRPHSKEEWDHAIDQVKKYERHVETHDIDNGVLEEASRWLRNEYQKHLVANDFLDTQIKKER